MARACLEAARPEAEAKDLAVQVSTVPADVLGSHMLLARMVANLVGNAIHHNVAGGWVRVSTFAEAGMARLVVENGGPVLMPERVAQLGEPFYRPGSERVGHGHGLGLSVAMAVAVAHGGRLVLEARAEGGLRATVHIPARSGP